MFVSPSYYCLSELGTARRDLRASIVRKLENSIMKKPTLNHLKKCAPGWSWGCDPDHFGVFVGLKRSDLSIVFVGQDSLVRSNDDKNGMPLKKWLKKPGS